MCNCMTFPLVSTSATGRTVTHIKNKEAGYDQNFVFTLAPNPSLVFLMTAVSGASKPPENPMVAPSDQPIDANIINPMFVSSIFGAAWETRVSVSLNRIQ